MLPEIPFFDARETGLVPLASERANDVRAIVRASRGAFGPLAQLAGYIALPLGDSLARGWLTRSENPYAREIDDMADRVGVLGVHALNLSYEWGCSSGVYQTTTGATLLRVLDWPFPELGRHMAVVRQRGNAGEFLNATWPGVSGVFQAVAPERFAAALNQAPMRRHRGGLIGSWLKNRAQVRRSRALPPAHLLRRVFEEAFNYAAARDMLMHEPLALPVIYVLSGAKPGEGCVIERLEEDVRVHELGSGASVSAANHFTSDFNGRGCGWMPRAIDSDARALGLSKLAPTDATNFAWLTPPLINPLTRLAMHADAAAGTLALQGFEGLEPVTTVWQNTAG